MTPSNRIVPVIETVIIEHYRSLRGIISVYYDV